MAYMLCSQAQERNPWQGGSGMAIGSAVDIVRACLEHEPPDGLRVGPPQIAGTLTLFPIFRDAAGLDYVTLKEAKEGEKAVRITEVGGPGTVSPLGVRDGGALAGLIC